MQFLQPPSQSQQIGSLTLTSLLARIVTIAIVFACMLWLGVSVYPARSKLVFTPMQEGLNTGTDVVWSSDGMYGQEMPTGLGDIKINVEAYNKKREKDIAIASRKLLSLAISLKSDLEHESGNGSSADAVKKAREIEKLAHDVKETMRVNIIGPQ